MATAAAAAHKQPEPEPKARTLATRVNVAGQWYGPGDDVPPDVAAQVTNESAWAPADAAE